MVKPRGILNQNAFQFLNDSFPASGQLRGRKDGEGSWLFDTNTPAIQLQKNQAVVDTVGRVQASNGIFYVPGYDVGIGTTATSGYTTIEAGVYMVDATVAVSGVTIETYGGAVLVDGVEASGTQSFQAADARGAACVNIHGYVHADVGQVINVGVKSLHSTLTTIGSEDLVHAPAANMRILKVPSDEQSFNG